ncbi:MAG TPA: hypothetical protein VN154_11400 [Rhizomicrobium sp.]|nr:hypothetical protein [Rhizomicrobium sp.]
MTDTGEPRHEHRRSGIIWLDLTIALTALLISMTSLVVAIVHSRTLERMADANSKLVEANSWPFIGYNTGRNTDGAIWMGLANEGVGPAKIEAVELKWNGVARRNAVDFLEACCGYKRGEKGLSYEMVAGRVVRAGDLVPFVVLPNNSETEETWNKLVAARSSPALTLTVCYCSVFDECWQQDVAKLSLKAERIAACKLPPQPFSIPERP